MAVRQPNRIRAAPDEAAVVSAKLADLGGKPESHELSDEVVQEAETAAPEMPEETTAEAADSPAESATEASAEVSGKRTDEKPVA